MLGCEEGVLLFRQMFQGGTLGVKCFRAARLGRPLYSFDKGLRNQLTECIGTDFATTTHVLRLLNHPAVGLYIKSSFAEKIRCGDLS
jgi:hypothetical protein